MQNTNKNWILLFGVLFVIILVPMIFSIIQNDKNAEEDLETELYIEQIWFRNIEMLDNIPIDQSLLIQDQITYYFQEREKNVEELELIDGSLKEEGDYKLQFKANYGDGIITVDVDKDIVSISE